MKEAGDQEAGVAVARIRHATGEDPAVGLERDPAGLGGRDRPAASLVDQPAAAAERAVEAAVDSTQASEQQRAVAVRVRGDAPRKHVAVRLECERGDCGEGAEALADWETTFPPLPNAASGVPFVPRRSTMKAGLPLAGLASPPARILPSGWIASAATADSGWLPRPSCVITLPPLPKDESKPPLLAFSRATRNLTWWLLSAAWPPTTIFPPRPGAPARWPAPPCRTPCRAG